jgi:hypothetical protein
MGVTAYQTALISIKAAGDTGGGHDDGIDKGRGLDHCSAVPAISK